MSIAGGSLISEFLDNLDVVVSITESSDKWGAGLMKTLAIVLREPGQLGLAELGLVPPEQQDVVVDIQWSGISTGTERLLWSGEMPPFPGMGYPLVPGYESVGQVHWAGPDSGRQVGDLVFVPGANCYEGARGLFGGASSRVVVPGQRVIPIPDSMSEEGVLLALTATAYHALAAGPLPELIVGHGVLGRLLARLCVALGASPPTVWETQAGRRDGAAGYAVCHPDEDARKDYAVICDASGDSGLLDTLISRLGRGGEIVLAGFYHAPLSFSFPPAFLREARLRIAAEWRPEDLKAVSDLIAANQLSLHGLISHRQPAGQAPAAYEQAFGDPACLKMILDWRHSQ